MNINECWYKRVCTVETCTNNCLRYRLMHSLFKQSELPENLWVIKDLACAEKDYESFMELQEISKHIEDFVKSGNNLYICSANCGNGKTSWAIKLLYAYFDKVWHKSCFDCKALFVNVPKFLYNCKRSISQDISGFAELCKKINTVDLVIWDDIGEMSVTGYEHQILLQYIDDRINSGKSNIYTSNHDTQAQLYNVLGDRLGSRIWNCSKIVKFKEEDKRGLADG